MVFGGKDMRKSLAKSEASRGASLLEYMLLAALIMVVVVLGALMLGENACIMFSKVGSGFHH